MFPGAFGASIPLGHGYDKYCTKSVEVCESVADHDYSSTFYTTDKCMTQNQPSRVRQSQDKQSADDQSNSLDDKSSDISSDFSTNINTHKIKRARKTFPGPSTARKSFPSPMKARKMFPSTVRKMCVDQTPKHSSIGKSNQLQIDVMTMKIEGLEEERASAQKRIQMYEQEIFKLKQQMNGAANVPFCVVCKKCPEEPYFCSQECQINFD